MRISRSGSGALATAVVTAVVLAGCGSSAGGDASSEQDSAALAQVVAEHLESEPDTAYLLEYGETVRLDMTDPSIQGKSGGPNAGPSDDLIERFLDAKIAQYRDWTPMLDIKVDNARVLEDAYICLDFEIANNIPEVTMFSGEKEGKKEWWSTFLPTEALGGAEIRLREVNQHVNSDGELLDDVEYLPISQQVDYGLPGLTYEETTLTETKPGITFAELGETINGGHTYDDDKDSAVDGYTALPHGGTLTMTRCWSDREAFSVDFQGAEQGRLAESMKNGGFVVGMEISVPFHTVVLAVPFGITN